jgi:hypothetical protein
MLLGRRVTLVVEVVEQGGGGVKVDEGRAFIAGEVEPPGFCFAHGSDAGLDGKSMLAQALAPGPLAE